MMVDNPPRCSKSLSRVGVAVGVHPRVRGGALGVDEEVYAVYPGASRGSHALAERERERDDARAGASGASPGRTLAFPPSERHDNDRGALHVRGERVLLANLDAGGERVALGENVVPCLRGERGVELSRPRARRAPSRRRCTPSRRRTPGRTRRLSSPRAPGEACATPRAAGWARRGQASNRGGTSPTSRATDPRAGHRAPRSGPVEPVTTMHRGEVRSNPQPTRRVIHHTFIQHILQHSTRRSFVQSSVRVFPLPSVSSRERITWR